ncbi:MAG: putative metal-binding motif-containing protein [Polyangiales bacterium]
MNHALRSARPRALALLAVTALITACGESPTTFSDAATGMDAATPDAAEAGSPIRFDSATDGPRGMSCSRNSQCDDGVPCTTDFCAPDGRCVNVADPRMCDDGVFCNGIETCDARRGCVRGTPVACNDGFACTIDRCDEETKRCLHEPRDFDSDGDPDWRCSAPGCDGGVPEADGGACWVGGDCDESNPRVSSLLPEICGDGIDNNCNSFIDAMEPGGCTRPPGDNCDTAIDVSRGGRFSVSLTGTAGDFALRCSGNRPAARDVVLRLSLTEPQDIVLTAENAPGGSALLYLQPQNRCGSITETGSPDVRDCVLGFPPVWRARALPAGEYFLVLAAAGGSSSGVEAVVNVVLRPPTMPPTNDGCATPIVIPPAGGTFSGDLVGVVDDVSTRCSGSTPDLIYSITLTEPRDVSVNLTGVSTTSYLTASIVDRCARGPTTLRCTSGSPAQFTARNLGAGTYFIVVEGPATAGFNLEVVTAPPTTPPAGDTCMNPITLVPNTMQMGSYSNVEEDVTVSCASGQRDVVYQFTLSERSDVVATLRGGLSDVNYLAIQRSCGDRGMEAGCRAGFGATGARLTITALEAGTYFLIAKGTLNRDYTVTLDARPPVIPVNVDGNDTCDSAFAVPEGGGTFIGNTSTLRRDYRIWCLSGESSEDAVFRYRVDRRSRVIFSTEGSSFDTVMWLTQGDMCPGMNLSNACIDDAPGLGLAAAFDVTLDPGTYFVYVAGLNTTARGAYRLSITPTTL